MRGTVTLLIVGTVIATLGLAAVALYAFRRRVRERFLLSFGLFSILYGIALVVRNSAFRLGYTDGLLEAENRAGESFGDVALPAFIKEKQDFGAESHSHGEVLVNHVSGLKRKGCPGTLKPSTPHAPESPVIAQQMQVFQNFAFLPELIVCSWPCNQIIWLRRAKQFIFCISNFKPELDGDQEVPCISRLRVHQVIEWNLPREAIHRFAIKSPSDGV